MSVDLVVSSPLNGISQPVQDQDGNSSALYLTLSTDPPQPGSPATVNIPTYGRLVFGVGEDGFGEWIQNTAGVTNHQGYGISLFTNSQEQMRLSNGGNLYIGQESANCDTTMNGSLSVNGALSVSGLVSFPTFSVSGAVSFPGLQSGSGVDVVSGANGALAIQTSSARFKENIRELKDDFSRILSLMPVSFTYKDSGQEAIGYTAEELHEKELHRLVSYDEEGKPFSVNYKMLPVYLLEIVKKQQEMIGQLQQGLAQVLGGSAPAAAMAEG